MQLLIVILILVATVALTVRWVVRTAKGRGGCGCGCSGCPNGGGKECHCCDKGPTLPEINVDE